MSIRHFGSQHQETAEHMRVLGNLPADQGRTEEAAESYRQAMTLYETLHGRQHVNCLKAEARLLSLSE